ncbi:MAG: NfeD family protein [Alphaproteobacteria bacterium]|nr:NfeD family protein [Alphaproteobacteria bacterium]
MPPLAMFWYWLAGGVLLMIAEVFVPGVTLLWLGVAATITGLVLIFLPDLALEFQGLIFAVLAVVSVVVGRMVYRADNNTPTDHPTLNRRAEQYVGQVYRLNAEPVDGRASVHIGDTVWNVVLRGDAAAHSGDHVRVVGADGAVLVVEPVTPA